MDKLPKYAPQEYVCDRETYDLLMRDCIRPIAEAVQPIWGFPVRVVLGRTEGFWLGNPPSVTKIDTVYNAEGISMRVYLSTNWPVKNIS
jgi:hypothetical protein